MILPGVGAFPKAMTSIRDLGLDEVVGERVAAGVPVLGICLGCQLLFARRPSSAAPTGLGLLDGEVDRAAGERPEGAAHRLVAGRLDAGLAR